MNSNRGLIIRAILGAYLAFIGARLLMQVISHKPSDSVMMSVFAVAFMIIGAAYAVFSLRNLWKGRKDSHILEDEDLTEELQERQPDAVSQNPQGSGPGEEPGKARGKKEKPRETKADFKEK